MPVDRRLGNPYPEGVMEVRVNNPDLEEKVNQWVTETGRSADELVEDAMAGYFDELRQVREMLDNRYDDIKSGKVKAIDGEEAFARLREKSEARRKSRL
jgi:hypothetical protein